MTKKQTTQRAAPARIWIGTSGWSYDGWRGALYPERLPKKNWLRYYGSQFGSAEINSSFYRTPSLEAVRSWRRDTPSDFAFAWKASKFMTHWKRLLPTCENSIALMQTRLRVLGPKVAVVLFQLPRHFGKNAERLHDFLHIDAVLRWQSERREVFVYFDNDQKAAAPRDARRLLRILGQECDVAARTICPAAPRFRT